MKKLLIALLTGAMLLTAPQTVFAADAETEMATQDVPSATSEIFDPTEEFADTVSPNETEDFVIADNDTRNESIQEEEILPADSMGESAVTDEIEPEAVQDGSTEADTSEEETDEPAEAEPKEEETLVAAAPATVTYKTHVQNIGWQGDVSNGAVAGTSGRALRLEGICIRVNAPYAGSVEYRTHVQDYGWLGWTSNYGMSGTQGQAKRLEAIQIRLTGELANHYDIYYQVHAQNFGWLGWAVNGGYAGTAGYAYRLEAIRIVLVEKGGAAPGSTYGAYYHPLIKYQTHVQNIGWQGNVSDGSLSGTSGRALRLEGIKINLDNQEYSGSVQYRTHVQNIGWQGWVSNGAMSGTTGKSYRLEAIQIQLTGEMAKHYDIYYRVHTQDYGWLGWACNGGAAGTEGMAKRLEAIQIQLVRKGGAAPGSTATPYYSTAVFLSQLRINSVADQIVLVNANYRSTAKVELWSKNNAGAWTLTRSMNGFVGSKGVGAAQENVARTPKGVYGLGFAFGMGTNPGCRLPYRQITNNSYWIGNSKNPNYNTWQEMTRGATRDDEHLIEYKIPYKYAITMNFNNGIGGGAAFFLHVSNGMPTLGCVSVPENDMLYLMRTIGSKAYIVNVNSLAELQEFR